MKVWYAKAGDIKVRDLIEKVVSWVKAGYVSPDVWLDLKGYVRSVKKKPESAAGDCKTYLTFSMRKNNRSTVPINFCQ